MDGVYPCLLIQHICSTFLAETFLRRSSEARLRTISMQRIIGVTTKHQSYKKSAAQTNEKTQCTTYKRCEMCHSVRPRSLPLSLKRPININLDLCPGGAPQRHTERAESNLHKQVGRDWQKTWDISLEFTPALPKIHPYIRNSAKMVMKDQWG